MSRDLICCVPGLSPSCEIVLNGLWLTSHRKIFAGDTQSTINEGTLRSSICLVAGGLGLLSPTPGRVGRVQSSASFFKLGPSLWRCSRPISSKLASCMMLGQSEQTCSENRQLLHSLFSGMPPGMSCSGVSMDWRRVEYGVCTMQMLLPLSRILGSLVCAPVYSLYSTSVSYA